MTQNTSDYFYRFRKLEVVYRNKNPIFRRVSGENPKSFKRVFIDYFFFYSEILASYKGTLVELTNVSQFEHLPTHDTINQLNKVP